MDRKAAEEVLAKLSPKAREAWEEGDLDVDPSIMAEFIALELVQSKFDWTDKADEIEQARRERDSAEALLENITGEDFSSAIDEFAGWADGDILDDYEINAPAAKRIIEEAEATIRGAYDKALDALRVLGGLDSEAEAA